MRIHDLINEIKELKQNTPRKSAFDIFNLLTNNKTLFLQHMDGADLEPILAELENLVNASTRDYSTDYYKSDVQKTLNLLMFYLDRII